MDIKQFWLTFDICVSTQSLGSIKFSQFTLTGIGNYLKFKSPATLLGMKRRKRQLGVFIPQLEKGIKWRISKLGPSKRYFATKKPSLSVVLRSALHVWVRAREKHSHYLETAPLFHFVVKFVLLSYNIKVHNGSMKVCNDNVQVHNSIKVPDDDVKSTQWWYDILLNIYIYYILHNIIYYNDTYKIAQSKCKSAWQWSFWHSIQLSTVFPQLFLLYPSI